MPLNVPKAYIRPSGYMYNARCTACYLALGLLFCGCPSQVWSQANDPFAPVMQPLQPARASRLPQLSDLTMVKLDQHNGQMQLVMMLDSYRTEKRTGPVTTFQQAQKTRTVEVDGKKVEQTYTVNVPVSAEGEIEVKIPAGRKPVTKPASQFRFVDVHGQEVSQEAAAAMLKTLQPAFLLDRFVGELPEIPEIYPKVLHEKCLIILTEELLRERSHTTVRGQPIPAQLFERAVAPVRK